MKIFKQGVLLVLALGLTGCDSSATRSPSAPSATASAVPGSVSVSVSEPPLVVSDISGFVLDTAFRPLAGARIEVLDGPQTGTSTTADATGEFSLSGTFDGTTRFLATQDGHAAATQVWNCSVPDCAYGARPWLGFYLDVAATPVDLAGEYTVTFIADSACTDLPPTLRTRTYSATIAPDPDPPGSNGSANTSMAVKLGGASFLGNLGGFGIGVAGDYAAFWLHGGHDPAVVEQLAPNTYLAFSGNAETTLGTGMSTISMPLDGWIDYCVTHTPLGEGYNCGTDNTTGSPVPGAVVRRTRCESRHHQLSLTRR